MHSSISVDFSEKSQLNCLYKKENQLKKVSSKVAWMSLGFFFFLFFLIIKISEEIRTHNFYDLNIHVKWA